MNKEEPAFYIKNSIRKQIENERQLPYTIKGCAKGTKENMIVSAIVVFTIRDDFWRDRVRHVMKKLYLNSHDGVIKLPNQQNRLSVIVVLFNKDIRPIEIIAIVQDTLENYLSEEGIWSNNERCKEEIFSIESIINSICTNYNIPLNNFHIMIEPELSNASPFVLTYKGDVGITADLIKIRPVLSFKRDEQRITIDTYNRSLFHIIK
jgi:hypothetical protein